MSKVRILSLVLAACLAAGADPATRPQILPGAELARCKGCLACHSVDGTPNRGPTWKGLFGSQVTVYTDGQERVLLADEVYLRRAILESRFEVVKGFPMIMPEFKGQLSEAEVERLIEYLRTLAPPRP